LPILKDRERLIQANGHSSRGTSGAHIGQELQLYRPSAATFALEFERVRLPSVPQ
jgi:hypothetical protein